MAETIMVYGASSAVAKTSGKEYGLLHVGIDKGPNGFDTFKLFCKAGIEKGFQGPGLYQVDGPMEIKENNGFASMVIVPQVLRKVDK